MKKTLSILLVLALMLTALSALGISAAADEGDDDGTDDPPIVIAPAAPTFTGRDVNAYVFGFDSTKSIYCLFLDTLPDVPYIAPEDYLNVIYTDPFTTEGEGSVYTVTNAYEETMVIDAENDKIYLKDYDTFTDCYINEEGISIEINYIKGLDGDYSVEPGEITIDLAAYGIDILEEDGKVYLPLTVITAMFSTTYNNAVYMDGDIYFVHTFDPESYYDNEVDQSPLAQALTRTQEEALFNYNTLCFFFDYFYGNPSNTVIAASLEEKGLDKTLDEFDETTVFIKELLLSENRSEYLTGLAGLGYYLFDGGHTVLMNTPVVLLNYYYEEPLPTQWYADIQDDTDEADLFWSSYYALSDAYDYYVPIENARDEAYAQYEEEIVKVWEEDGAYLIIHGDTAVFVFDSFEQDTPYDIKEALDIAKEAGCKNFIIDDTCNGGGYVAAYEYICCLITNNEENHTNKFTTARSNPLTGSVYESNVQLDLNLDGEFDDLDSEVYYDFNFAIVTSGAAFSCGNELPVSAAKLGVLVIGEPSGGGSCIVTERYLADGLAFPIGDISKSVLPDGSDVDLGAPVSTNLVIYDEEGNPDYSQFFDIDLLAGIVGRYYGDLTGVLYGDVNGDNVVNKKDSLLLKKYLSDNDVRIDKEAADVQYDGYVNKKDSLLLRKYLAGWDVVLGPAE